jgi:hypothetical protein
MTTVWQACVEMTRVTSKQMQKSCLALVQLLSRVVMPLVMVLLALPPVMVLLALPPVMVSLALLPVMVPPWCR